MMIGSGETPRLAGERLQVEARIPIIAIGDDRVRRGSWISRKIDDARAVGCPGVSEQRSRRMRHGTVADVYLSVQPGETTRVRRPSRVTAHADFLGGSGRDGRNEYCITPNLAIQALAHVCELGAIGPDLR